MDHETNQSGDFFSLPCWEIKGDRVFKDGLDIGSPPSSTIYFYEQTLPPSRPSRKLPEGVQIKSVNLTPDPKIPEPCPSVLTEEQFSALYNSIAKVSSWWPMTAIKDGWDYWHLFHESDVHVMYRENMPVGFIALERDQKKRDEVKVLFVGVIPSCQGQGLGGLLFDYAIDLAWHQQGETIHRVSLDTVPENDRMIVYDRPCSSMYKKKGFQLYDIQTCKPGDPGLTLNQFNLPSYWEGVDMKRQEAHLIKVFDVDACHQKSLVSPLIPKKRHTGPGI